MKAKVLLPLLLSVIAAPALASDALESVFIGAPLQVAQMTPEVRRMMRERWEQAGPEERMDIQRQFQERGARRQPNQEQRDSWSGRIPNPPSPADFMNMGNGFGTGFERRAPGPDADDSATNYDPRNRFNHPAGRNRR